MKDKVLVVAAHPDDEVLGCGGTIARHVNEDYEVHVLILAEGATSRRKNRDRQKDTQALHDLAVEAQEANKKLGVSSVTLLDFPDNRLDSVDLLDLIKTVEGYVDKYQPDIVYTHHAGDLNLDHQLVHKAVVTACRPVPGHPVKTLMFFEIPSSSEWQVPGLGLSFEPNWFSDISSTLDVKLDACRSYASEMRSAPHPRSLTAIEHLARWRGASIGVQAAEAFVLGRKIQ